LRIVGILGCVLDKARIERDRVSPFACAHFIDEIDSGSGFDPVEVARRYRESLRAAAPIRGQGLGLFLISRICDRFGWKFSIENLPFSGTRARLDLSASLLIDSDAP